MLWDLAVLGLIRATMMASSCGRAATTRGLSNFVSFCFMRDVDEVMECMAVDLVLWTNGISA